MVGHGPSADGNRLGRGNPHQSFVVHRRAGQTRHIPGGGIVVLMIQAVGIGKGGVLHTQLLSGLVHHADKPFLTAAHVVRNGHRRIVAGTQQQSVKEGLQRQLLPLLEVHGGPLRHGRLPGDFDHVVQVSFPDGHQGREDLGGAGDEHFLVGVVFIQNTPAVYVHQN